MMQFWFLKNYNSSQIFKILELGTSLYLDDDTDWFLAT